MTDSRSRRDFLRLVATSATLAGTTTHVLADDKSDGKCKKVTANDRIGLAKDHFKNFFASCRTRKTAYQDATFGLRAAGPAVLSNLSLWEKRPLAWDPETMTTPAATPAPLAKPAGKA